MRVSFCFSTSVLTHRPDFLGLKKWVSSDINRGKSKKEAGTKMPGPRDFLIWLSYADNANSFTRVCGSEIGENKLAGKR